MHKNFIILILLQLFVFGGSIQFLGIISLTQLDLLISMEILVYILFISKSKTIVFNKPLIFLLIYILIQGIIQQSDILYILGYEMFIFIPFIVLILLSKIQSIEKTLFIYNFLKVLFFI